MSLTGLGTEYGNKRDHRQFLVTRVALELKGVNEPCGSIIVREVVVKSTGELLIILYILSTSGSLSDRDWYTQTESSGASTNSTLHASAWRIWFKGKPRGHIIVGAEAVAEVFVLVFAICGKGLKTIQS
jgi:hypothetical protein